MTITFTHQRLRNFSSIVFYMFLISIQILTVNDWKWPVHLWRDAWLRHTHEQQQKKNESTKSIGHQTRPDDGAKSLTHSLTHDLLCLRTRDFSVLMNREEYHWWCVVAEREEVNSALIFIQN